MFRHALLVALAAASPAAGHALAQPPGAEAPRESLVVTSGEAVIRIAPDRAHVRITAESRSRNPKDAPRRNAEAMNDVQEKLKRAGIPPEALRTLVYDLQPEFDYVDGKQTLRGYVARHSIEVRVDAIDRLGEIIDLAVQSGATSISGVRFDLKDRGAVEREALRQAVADARSRAEAAASGAGRSIDRIVRIEEQGVSFVPPPRPMTTMARAEAAEPTPIAKGEIEIRSQVTLTAAIK